MNTRKQGAALIVALYRLGVEKVPVKRVGVGVRGCACRAARSNYRSAAGDPGPPVGFHPPFGYGGAKRWAISRETWFVEVLTPFFYFSFETHTLFTHLHQRQNELSESVPEHEERNSENMPAAAAPAMTRSSKGVCFGTSSHSFGGGVDVFSKRQLNISTAQKKSGRVSWDS